MSNSISPANCDDIHEHEIHTPTSAPNTLDNSVSSQNDISKYIQSLQARLYFARFKMKQGWENSTLLDVEQLWKQKQQKLIDELPKPRFTQRDIIDKKVYIPSPGARHARAKKAKLVRTYSTPSSHQQQQNDDDSYSQFTRNQNDNVSGESSNRINTTKSQIYFRHYNVQHSSQRRPESQMMDCNQSTPSSSDGEDGEDENNYGTRYPPIAPSPPVRNSLDFLSYAIAITEEAARDEVNQSPTITSSQPLPDISRMNPNLVESFESKEKSVCAKRKLKAREDVSELNVGTSITTAATADDCTSSPSSTVFTAAKTIMMFADSHPPPLPSAHSSLYPSKQN